AERLLARIAEAAGMEAEEIMRIAPVEMAKDVAAVISSAAKALGEQPLSFPSGAGHDAMVLGRHVPAAMLFVPSIGGRSHDVSENTSDDDIVLGCEVLAEAVARLRAAS